MKLPLAHHKYIYTFNYDYNHNDLCKVESKQIFGEEEKNKILFSNIEIDPSISPFIRNRFDIILFSEDYSELLKKIEHKNIHAEGFKAEYLVMDDDATGYGERLNKLKDIGYIIEGEPDYYKPTITYSLCKYNNVWCFGVLIKHNADWQKHKKKPCSFSNSINMDVAKSLVAIATKGNKNNSLLDACCGVGTIMLEACVSGFNVEGCDINFKTVGNTNKNLEYYNYNSYVHYSDIKDLHKKYDAAIIDLPYNLYTYSTDDITFNIIESTAKLTDRIVIVSIADIEDTIKNIGLKITDYCTVEKRGKSKFTRKIWVCEKESTSKN